MSNILVMVLLGAIAGWVAQKIVGKSRGGLIPNIIIGIIGSFIGGFIFEYFDKSGVTGLNLHSIAVASIGSIVLLVVVRIISK